VHVATEKLWPHGGPGCIYNSAHPAAKMKIPVQTNPQQSTGWSSRTGRLRIALIVVSLATLGRSRAICDPR
jgi:hypothetical protein